MELKVNATHNPHTHKTLKCHKRDFYYVLWQHPKRETKTGGNLFPTPSQKDAPGCPGGVNISLVKVTQNKRGMNLFLEYPIKCSTIHFKWVLGSKYYSYIFKDIGKFVYEENKK